MNNPLTRKLELFGPLTEEDKRLLDDTVTKTRKLGAHQDIVREGDATSDVHLVLSGMACRYKILPGGRRSIFAFLVPGDFCDLHIFILKAMDHSIMTLSPSVIVDIPRDRILELSKRPGIVRALWWATLVDEATLREALVNIGRRDAETGIAHLFCELHLRLESIQLTSGGEFSLPMNQTDLADAVGLSTVHVNRSLMSLRSRGLIDYGKGTLVILDVRRLKAFCDFNPNYLHLGTGKSD